MGQEEKELNDLLHSIKCENGHDAKLNYAIIHPKYGLCYESCCHDYVLQVAEKSKGTG